MPSKPLRRRLMKIGLGELDHIIMTLTPAGAGVIRSNYGPDGLRERGRSACNQDVARSG
jgi:hypothetical protein